MHITILPSDLLDHCLSFLLDSNHAEMMKTLVDLENALPLSNVRDSIERQWQRLQQDDQQRINSRWKTSCHVNKGDKSLMGRDLGRDFLCSQETAQQLSKESCKVYQYGIRPVSFFCPVPMNRVDEKFKRQVSPQTWPHHVSSSTHQQYVFVNITQHTTGGTLWEGYRPIEEASTTNNFQVSWNLQSFLQELPSKVNKIPLEMYYRMISMNRNGSLDYFVTTSPDDDENEHVITIPISKCQQLESILKQFQVTILYESKLLVATGGCQSIRSPLCGRFHDRTCPANDYGNNKFSSVVTTTLEFKLDKEQKENDRLCINVSKAK